MDNINQEKKTKIFESNGNTFVICKDGTVQRLTLLEKMSLKVGILSLDILDKKYNSDPCKS